MEVIKFKAISKDTVNWVYGDLLHKNSKTFIYTDDGLEIEIYDETVCQFTGLKDNNDTDIYEHDIITYHGVDSFCVNPDCDAFLHMYQSYISHLEAEVIYNNGTYELDEVPIYCAYIHKESLDDIIEDIGDMDPNGVVINEDITGLLVVGNEFDNFKEK